LRFAKFDPPAREDFTPAFFRVDETRWQLFTKHFHYESLRCALHISARYVRNGERIPHFSGTRARAPSMMICAERARARTSRRDIFLPYDPPPDEQGEKRIAYGHCRRKMFQTKLKLTARPKREPFHPAAHFSRRLTALS